MANGIKIGTNNISGIKIGAADVDAVYIGTTLVYSGGTPTPPTPTYTLVTIDGNFDTSTPVYEIHVDWLTTDDDNESFDFYDNPSFSINGYYNCVINFDENSGLYELEIIQYPNWTTVYSHSYSSSTDINLDFIAIFGRPMYFQNKPLEQGECIDEQCISEECPPGCEDCAEWDEETGDCIETTCNCPPECVDWMCMEFEPVYIATAKIIQQN